MGKKITIIETLKKNFKLRQFYRQTFGNFEVNKKKRKTNKKKQFKKIQTTRGNKKKLNKRLRLSKLTRQFSYRSSAEQFRFIRVNNTENCIGKCTLIFVRLRREDL